MYSSYFGLTEKPFATGPDPRYLYKSEPHQEALEHLRNGIDLDGCFILLTGDVGTGKTTVCRYLLAEIRDSILIPKPRLTVLELLVGICEKLGIPCDLQDAGNDFYREQIKEYLIAAVAEGRSVVLFIDEAQNASVDIFVELCLLADLEHEQKKLLKIVLLGQPELRQILEQVEAGSVSLGERITARYHLMPLNRKDSASYIVHRLAVAGERTRIFSHSALFKVYNLSGGVPRRMNDLCDRALEATYQNREYLVTPAMLEGAARELAGAVSGAGRMNSRRQLWGRILGGTLLFLVLFGTLSWYLSQQKPVSPPGLEKQDIAIQSLQVEGEEETVPSQSARVRISPLEIRD